MQAEFIRTRPMAGSLFLKVGVAGPRFSRYTLSLVSRKPTLRTLSLQYIPSRRQADRGCDDDNRPALLRSPRSARASGSCPESPRRYFRVGGDRTPLEFFWPLSTIGARRHDSCSASLPHFRNDATGVQMHPAGPIGRVQSLLHRELRGKSSSNTCRRLRTPCCAGSGNSRAVNWAATASSQLPLR